ncbi:MAG: enoyl-CoA hydratase-related protein [Myxococcota bacterium]
MSEYQTLLYEKKGRSIRITLNRPDKRNALSPEVLSELDQAFQRADKDSEACVVVLTGAGDKAFCAGADLGGFAEASGLLEKYEAQGLFPRLFRTMEDLSKPTLAAVNGTCVAGGFGLMMACDLAIAKESAKLGTPEIARGLFPYMISHFILRNVPRRRAMEIMLLGELFSAKDAETWGVLNRVVSDADFNTTVEAWTEKIASYSPAVLRLGRKALIRQAGMPLGGALEYLQGLLTVNTMTEDAMEGIAAFFEKRPPVWKGK